MTSSTDKLYPWQQTQWQQCLRQREQNRLPHAYLFTGPSGTGKTQFARTLIQSLHCEKPADALQPCGQCRSCRLIGAGTHPDAHSLLPTPPKTKSTAKRPVLSIKIDDMRMLCEALAETSQLQGYRTAVIESAEKMTTETANSLLKTLEEPGNETLIILVSAHPNRLPVTIRSRCQQVRFPVPDMALAAKWLRDNGRADAVDVLRLVHGSPLRAAEWKEEKRAEHALLVEALTAAQAGKPSLGLCTKLADLPREDALGWLLDWSADVIRITTAGSECELVNEKRRAQLAAKAASSDVRKLHLFHDQVKTLVRSSSIALRPELMWENLLISWDNV